MAYIDRFNQDCIKVDDSFYDQRQTMSELVTTRKQLFDCKTELEHNKQLLVHYKSQNALCEANLAKTKLSLDTVLKELTARTGTVQHLTNANIRLKCDLEGVSHLGSVAEKGPNYNTTYTSSRKSASLPLSSRITSANSNIGNRGISHERHITGSSAFNSHRSTQYSCVSKSPYAIAKRSIPSPVLSAGRLPIPKVVCDSILITVADEKSDLENVQGEVDQAQDQSLSYKSAPTTASIHTIPFEGNVLHPKAPLALYLQSCFDDNIDPCPTAIRSLYEGTTLKCGSVDAPILYSQMNHLLKVFLSKESLQPHDMVHWYHFTRLSVCTENEETLELLPALMEQLPYLCELEVRGMTGSAAQRFAGAISTADNLHKLEMPDLKVSDEGFQVIMKVVANRYAAVKGTDNLGVTQGADSRTDKFSALSPLGSQSKNSSCAAPPNGVGSSGKVISVTNLDLSQTNLCESTSFYLIRGSFIQSINFEGLIGLHDKFLGEVIRSCPNLIELNLNRCHSLTKDAIMYVNLARNLHTLKMVGCPAINNVRLFFVKEFHSDFRGITHFNAPELTTLPNPLSNFNCVTFGCPKLQMITFQGAILTRREFTILSDSDNLLSANFVNCRINGLDLFLKKMRKLVRLSIHGSKGVVDSDLSKLCCFLESLDLTDCFCVTDKVLKGIGESLEKLSRLVLKRCSSVTDGGLSYLSNTNIKYLNLLGMRKITNEGIVRLCHLMPALQHIVHETFTAVDLVIDRRDDEEDQRALMAYEERLIITRRQDVALEYVSSSSSAIASLKKDAMSPRPPQVANNDSTRPQSHRDGSSTTLGGSEDGDRIPNDWKSPIRMSSIIEKGQCPEKDQSTYSLETDIITSQEIPVEKPDSNENKDDDIPQENGETIAIPVENVVAN